MSSFTQLAETETEKLVDNETNSGDQDEETQAFVGNALHPQLKNEDDKVQVKVNRTTRKKRLARIKKPKYTTADSYLTTSRRQALAQALQEKARAHKINFNRLSEYCEANPEIPGVIHQVQSAATLLSNNQSLSEVLPQAIAAGESQLAMEAAMRELEQDLDKNGAGVSVLCCLELTRRILDAELDGSEELVQKDTGGDEDEGEETVDSEV